ncbi:COG1361 S-layer family protein [Natrialbaceae archaeon AArc-T1-2]|uniref:COG1361 S-layer family protein n=1 Tax=Natrialbaceae archaeon AArc-T1-2 TaxID=3053904 RepID=UPI00255AFBEB|nr:exo-alpha-sialidase [Natrialbaceae archaeon AArc-T1-2]WIV68265.1 exo-alpha-sialidase [Natrialbaceae archaeon AArc-T1-2]
MNARSVLVAAVAVAFVVSLPALGFVQAGEQSEPTQPSPAIIDGEPDLEAFAPDRHFVPGTASELSLQVANDGEFSSGDPDARELVTTARNVRVAVDDDSVPFEVRTGTQAIGSVSENEPREQVPFEVHVPEDVDHGEYEVDVELEYSYTDRYFPRAQSARERTTTTTETITIEVDDAPRFEVVDAHSDVQVGEEGTATLAVENVGDEDARDVRLTSEATSSRLAFGERETDTTHVDEWKAGERQTVTYDVVATPDASARSYAFETTARYDDSEGVPGADEGITWGLTPAGEQRFSVESTETSLRVGEDGAIYGTVRNDGPTKAENVVLRYTDETPNVVPIETAVAVGTLEPGESGEFRLPLEVTGEADAVDRTLDVGVQYRTADLEQRLYEDVELLAAVEPKRDQFDVDVTDREIAAGETKSVDVEVTNNLDQTVTDVEARLFADDPLDSDDDEGFVEELEPGESVTMTFELEAASGATAKTYPISFDFRYDDERGTSQLSETTRVAIDVDAPEDDFPWLLVGLVVASGLGGGAYVYRHR